MESKQRPSLDDCSSTASSVIRRMTHSSSQRLRRNSSPSSATPTIAPPVAEVPPSCVSRETLENECGLHRFIVWAAVKRNSCSQMTAEERRECPLLRCRKRFANHELMLQHLYTCDQLAAAEYWCYDCGKVERFSDAKCRRCLGHPSKRRKIMSMARNFFSSLGHRNRNGQLADLDQDMDDAPPSYDSILEPPQTELSSNEIHEMGSTDRAAAPLADDGITTTALDAPEPEGRPHPDPVVEPPSPLEITPPAHPIMVTPIPVSPVELDSVSIEDALINWEPSPTPPLKARLGSPSQLAPIRTPDKPILQLHTSGLSQYRSKMTSTATAATTARSKTLAPSSSVRSTCSTASNQSVMSTASYEVTPMSAWSGTWDRAAGFESTQTSPDELINMDDLVPTASFVDVAKMDTAKEKYGEHGSGDGFLAELPADLPMINPFPTSSLLPGTLDTDQSVFSFDAAVPTELSIESNVALTDPINVPLDMSELIVGQSWNHQVDASSLVESARAVLHAHVQSSILNLKHVSHCRLANDFCSMSPDAVALAGLKSFQAILEGSTVLSSIDVICFIHLAYSLVLVVHEQDTPSRSKDLFIQARSYSSYVPPQDVPEYFYVVDSLWEPNDGNDAFGALQNQAFGGSQATVSSMSDKMRGKQPQGHSISSSNAFLSVSQHYLDELEYAVWHGATRLEIVASDLYGQHLRDHNLAAPPDSPLFYAMNYLLRQLAQEYGGVPDFVTTLRNMLGRLDSNYSIRRLELELLRAGRVFLSPTLFFDRYIDSVRTQIDSLRLQADVRLDSLDRTGYHLKGIKLMQSLIHGPMLPISTGWESGIATTEPAFGPLDQFMTSITPNLGDTSRLGLIPTTALHSMEDAATTMPGVSLDASTLSPTPYLPNPDVAATPARRSSAAAAMTPPSPAASSSPAKLVEADMCCDKCGYRPKGDPKWFGGSMAKHKKLQHATSPPKIYSCPYPGCTSQYKNRPDNLRQHQLDKGHFVDGQDESSRRPSKRKRTK